MKNIQNVVLDELRAKEQKPSELLELMGRKGYKTLETKQALTRLLDDQKIKLTSNRILRVCK